VYAHFHGTWVSILNGELVFIPSFEEFHKDQGILLFKEAYKTRQDEKKILSYFEFYQIEQYFSLSSIVVLQVIKFLK
jgi:hypothetical protein